MLETNSEAKVENPDHLHPFSRMFFGPDGLRAGWSALVFSAIFVVCMIFTNLLVHTLFHGQQSEHGSSNTISLSRSLGELIVLGFCLGTTAIMARIEDRPLTSYGLSGKRKTTYAFTGFFWGFLFLTFLIGALYLTHNLGFDGIVLSFRQILTNGLISLIGMFVVSFFEETLLRGYLQWTLARGMGFWWAALLLSLSFGLLHRNNLGESPIGLFSAGAIGLVFCLSIWYTGSLWWAIGFHAAWDWGESFFYGTPNSGAVLPGHLISTHPIGKIWMSGGATGPEGSLLIVPLIILVAIVLYITVGPKSRWSFNKSAALEIGEGDMAQ